MIVSPEYLLPIPQSTCIPYYFVAFVVVVSLKSQKAHTLHTREAKRKKQMKKKTEKRFATEKYYEN